MIQRGGFVPIFIVAKRDVTEISCSVILFIFNGSEARQKSKLKFVSIWYNGGMLVKIKERKIIFESNCLSTWLLIMIIYKLGRFIEFYYSIIEFMILMTEELVDWDGDIVKDMTTAIKFFSSIKFSAILQYNRFFSLFSFFLRT